MEIKYVLDDLLLFKRMSFTKKQLDKKAKSSFEPEALVGTISSAWMKSIPRGTTDNMENIRRRISTKKTKILELEQDIRLLMSQIKDKCNHPVDALYHNGFSTSSGNCFSETITCECCGKMFSKRDQEVPNDYYTDI